jgi:GntP family gluconate:H+ symporter
MDTPTALKSQTVSTLIQGLAGISIIMVLGWVFV